MSSVCLFTAHDLSLPAGARVRQRRWMLGMSREHLARVTEVSVAWIAQFENGERCVDRRTLNRLALAIGFSPRVLMNVIPSAGRRQRSASQPSQRGVCPSNVIPLRR